MPQRVTRSHILLGLAIYFLTAAVPNAVAQQSLDFQLTYDKKVASGPFTGRVYILLSKQVTTQLPSGPNWFRPEPFFAKDVKGWQPGEPIMFASEALSFPAPLAGLDKGTYSVLAVMDFNRGDISFATAEGNGYSKPIRLALDPATSGIVKLDIDQVYHARPFQESNRVKLVDIESDLLSKSHGRTVRMRAGVILPKSFAQGASKRYPVIYMIPGFGGTHTFAQYAVRGSDPTEVSGVEMLYVVLDPSCTWGHHVFADSASNGPRGQALVQELIPHIEKTYRGIGVPGTRFVTGHSSGGWSSLWLQVTYPDFFGGVWSTAPDPVDFRDFQRINVYKPGTNMFVDDAGQHRPIARNAGKPILWYKPFSDMEVIMGHGGQLQSFEAVFGSRGPDGKPKQLWNRVTGAIDAQVARSWENYDIRLVLERNWQKLGPKLAGKLHVYMGLEDTFYLEGATILLKESLAKLGSDAVVEIFQGKDHSTLMGLELRQRIAREMAEQFRRHLEPAR
jgi:S-formylglutathione hydrolase FrmB